VNAVCPGPVETRMMRSLESQRNPADPRAVHDANSANTPTGRYATPEEVANAVMYLCSDLASDITGTHLVIDGGRSGSGGAPSGTRRWCWSNIPARSIRAWPGIIRWCRQINHRSLSRVRRGGWSGSATVSLGE